jgi:hypothetical protein
MVVRGQGRSRFCHRWRPLIVDTHLGRITNPPRLAGLLPRYRASSSMGCLSALQHCQAGRLSGIVWLNGGKSAIEYRMGLRNFVGREPLAFAWASLGLRRRRSATAQQRDRARAWLAPPALWRRPGKF